MPLESMGLRRWLLATVAAWAALVWVAGWFGLGGRVRPLPEDPALVQPLPALAAAALPVVGSVADYADIAARPLFAEDRRPHPFLLSGGQDAAPDGFDYRLTGVLLTPALEMAILQPAAGGEPVRVRLGEGPPRAEDWRLTELQPRSARFEGPDGVRLLELRTFDGVGGDAPGVPPMARTGAAPPPAGAPAPAATRSAETQPEPEDGEAPAEARSGADPEQEAEAIRRRIEARRARIREEQAQGAAQRQNQ